MEESCVYTYKGAIHIHSKLSDGTGDINTISKAAKSAGLDWIIITDHNYIDSNEGTINGVYVIKGQEISPKQYNHYLTLGVNELIKTETDAQVYVDNVREKGGFGFAAHPDEGMIIDENGKCCPRKNSYHCIPWTDKSIRPDGVEIWNWFSNWADNLDDSNILKLAYAYLFKNKIVKAPSNITLKWWDDLNKNTDSIVPAIGGVDAHALKIYKYVIPVTVFPYKTCFKTITNFIHLSKPLSKDFSEAKKQILDAIKKGNNTIVNRNVSKNIPEIFVTNGRNTCYAGDCIELNKKCFLHYKSNRAMEICLIYNGYELKRITSKNFIYPITQIGKYRLEVRFKDRGFIYTNAFYIKDKVEN